MSGLEFQTKCQIDIPIIFITGHGDIAMSVKAIRAGAADFLTKPFREQEILDAVWTALGRDRTRRSHKQPHTICIAAWDAQPTRAGSDDSRGYGLDEQASRG